MIRSVAVSISVALAFATFVPSVVAADRAGAERQYRVARRLAAEGSPDAAAAYRRVVQLDPGGPLADDALVEEAALLPLARWPAALADLTVGNARAALALLDRAVKEQPDGDRIPEARYLSALVLLEPLPGYDLRKARANLVEVTASDRFPIEARRARYALAWILERQGQDDRAASAYQRIVIEAPSSEAASRARVALARIEIRDGGYGRAARWLQEAIEREAPGELRAEPLRELAVRRLLSDLTSDPEEVGASSRVATALRSVSDLAPAANDGVLLASRKAERVVLLDTLGRTTDSWEVVELQAFATDLDGRGYVAAGESLWRLVPGGGMRKLASLADYSPVEALAVDGLGAAWLLDRRGQRIGHIPPGAGAPETFWEDRAFRLVDLVRDGPRLVALDGRSRTLVAFESERIPKPIVSHQLVRPTALAVDPAGRIGVLDAKAGVVVFTTAVRGASSVFAFAAVGVERPVAIGLGLDGSLHLFDESGAGWFTER